MRGRGWGGRKSHARRHTLKRAKRLRKEPTIAERLLWERLRGHKLNNWGFRRQAPLDRFVIDFLCHTPALVVEVDGPLHRREEQKLFDAERDAIVTALGYKVVRVDEKLVRDDMLRVLRIISEAGGA